LYNSIERKQRYKRRQANNKSNNNKIIVASIEEIEVEEMKEMEW